MEQFARLTCQRSSHADSFESDLAERDYVWYLDLHDYAGDHPTKVLVAGGGAPTIAKAYAAGRDAVAARGWKITEGSDQLGYSVAVLEPVRVQVPLSWPKDTPKVAEKRWLSILLPQSEQSPGETWVAINLTDRRADHGEEELRLALARMQHTPEEIDMIVAAESAHTANSDWEVALKNLESEVWESTEWTNGEGDRYWLCLRGDGVSKVGHGHCPPYPF